MSFLTSRFMPWADQRRRGYKSATAARPLRVEALESRALLAADPTVGTALNLVAVDPAPAEWAAGDGGTKNLYTGLVWLDARGPSGSWMDLPYAQNYAANSTLNGQDDWRLPNLAEAQQAAMNGIGEQGVVFGAPATVYWHWTSTTSGNRDAWAIKLADPAGAAAILPKGSAFALNMVRDSAQTVDDGTVGYADTGWTPSKKNTGAAAHDGDYRQRAAGDGSHVATWTFSGLEVGATYKVATTWIAGSAQASNAPYTVLDGAAIEQSVLVNQKSAPNDFAVGNQSWEGLGSFIVDSGTISVRLSNLADGAVIADAVRLFKVASPAESSSTTALHSFSESDRLGAASALNPAAVDLALTGADELEAKSQVTKPFKITGSGVGPLGLPLPGEPARPHSIVGNATHLVRHTGAGSVRTDSAVFNPDTGTIQGEFGSGDPFVFTAANGDQLVCHYGRTDKGATEPGTFELTIVGATDDGHLIVEALFIAEFVVQPESTGKFAGATGSWIMYARTEPFILGTSDPVIYSWEGEGTLTFQKPKK